MTSNDTSSMRQQLIFGWPVAATKSPLGFQPTPAQEPTSVEQAVFCSDSESHLITVGPTGIGKGTASLMPLLISYEGPAVVIDVKGECVAVTAKRRQKMGHNVVVIDPFNVTDWPSPGAFNPLDLHHVPGLPVEDIAMEMPQLLRGGTGGSLSNQPGGEFWDTKADGLVGGVIAYILSAKENPADRTLISVRDVLMGDDVPYSLAVVLDTIGKKLPSLAYKQIASFLSTTEVTRSGILATATERVSALFHPGVERTLSSTSFDLTDLVDGKPLTIYLVIQPGKLQSHGRILRVWISSLLSLLQTRKARPKMPTLMLIDEASALCPLDSLRTAITLLRGYGVRTATYWQDLSQIKRAFPDWETLLNNCSVQILGTNTQAAAKSATEVTGPSFSSEEILNLPRDQSLLIEHGRSRRIRKLNYLTDPIFKGLAAPNPMYAPKVRTHPPVVL